MIIIYTFGDLYYNKFILNRNHCSILNTDLYKITEWFIQFHLSRVIRKPDVFLYEKRRRSAVQLFSQLDQCHVFANRMVQSSGILSF